jgi:hypothetical protein
MVSRHECRQNPGRKYRWWGGEQSEKEGTEVGKSTATLLLCSQQVV